MRFSDILHHYLGVCLVLVVAYFTIVAPILKHMEDTTHGSGPTVSVVQPTPSSKIAQVVGNVATAVSDRSTLAALTNQVIQLSAAQQTVSSALQRATGLNAKLSAALTQGLTTGSPKQQVVTVASSTSSKLVAATPGPSDDQIQRDLKTVLNDPSTHIANTGKTDVTVHWEDKPPSPFFAHYSSDGSSGIGYTFRHYRGFDLDGLFGVTNTGSELGVGIEHPIHGTVAGVGVHTSLDLHSHSTKVGVYFAIHS